MVDQDQSNRTAAGYVPRLDALVRSATCLGVGVTFRRHGTELTIWRQTMPVGGAALHRDGQHTGGVTDPGEQRVGFLHAVARPWD